MISKGCALIRLFTLKLIWAFAGQEYHHAGNHIEATHKLLWKETFFIILSDASPDFDSDKIIDPDKNVKQR